ncbi:hypothetical protein E4K10_39985 [Streptomyces sp. T1317-0309]|nr:hypothetical protein E4K10_39985 [Streptomyces sp. T1317-0309]
MPLWLQLESRHGWLWAYNLEHLDLIHRFVQASLRERAYDTGQSADLVVRVSPPRRRARRGPPNGEPCGGRWRWPSFADRGPPAPGGGRWHGFPVRSPSRPMTRWLP